MRERKREGDRAKGPVANDGGGEETHPPVRRALLSRQLPGPDDGQGPHGQVPQRDGGRQQEQKVQLPGGQGHRQADRGHGPSGPRRPRHCRQPCPHGRHPRYKMPQKVGHV